VQHYRDSPVFERIVSHPHNVHIMKCARSLGIILSIFTLFVSSALHTPLGMLDSASATSVSTLERQKRELERLAAQKEAEARKQAEVKAAAERKLQEVAGEINTVRDALNRTQATIVTTSSEIERKNQEIAALESELRRIKDQQDALLRQMYIMRASMPDEMLLFSDMPMSERERERARFEALKASVATLFVRTTAAKLAVEKTRSDLEKRNQELEILRAQQDEQRRGLASYQQTQVALRQNATVAMRDLEAQALKARQQAAAAEAAINAALSAAIRNSNRGIYGSGPGVGQRVSRGDFVGIQGSTGFSTGDHVHFEVRVNDVAVNPQPYINNGTLVPPMRQFVISQPFGKTSFSHVYAGGIHTGIDYVGPKGSAVYAPADGIVILNGCPSSCNSGYGRAWAMKLDNGLVVLMAHLRM
jgi:septal ring factor EnvC (AmiA/AmiB activator)